MAESSDPLFECASALKSHEVSHSQRGARATHLSCQAWYDEDDSLQLAARRTYAQVEGPVGNRWRRTDLAVWRSYPEFATRL